MELARLAALMSAQAMAIPIADDRHVYRYEPREQIEVMRRGLSRSQSGHRFRTARPRHTVKANRAANVRRMQRGA